MKALQTQQMLREAQAKAELEMFYLATVEQGVLLLSQMQEKKQDDPA